MLNVQRMEEIPGLNEHQCGTYQMHSLEEAQEIARGIIEQGAGHWRQP